MHVVNCAVPVVFLLAICVVCARTPSTFRTTRRHKNDQNKISAAERAKQLLEGLQGQPSECCPTVTEIVSPEIGKDRSGKAVELYRDGKQNQQFNETSCVDGVKDKPCRFIDRHFKRYTKCVQQHTYMYALVRDLYSNDAPRLDYIMIRSGCSCQLTPPDKSSSPPP